jgi:hypothetical protein
MTLKNLARSAAAIAAVVVLTGCMPKMTREQLRSMKPARPAELDRLNAFVGKWQFEGTATMAGLDEPLKLWGTSEGRWDGGNWYVVSHGVFNMEEIGAMTGGEAWTYDTKAKVYRQVFVEEGGTSGSGTATFNAETNTWKMTSKRYGAMGESTFKGECKQLDANTMEFTGTECSGLMKVGEFKGTMRRVAGATNPDAANMGVKTPAMK